MAKIATVVFLWESIVFCLRNTRAIDWHVECFIVSITINYKMICLKGAKFLGISFIFHSDNVLSMSIVIYIYLYMYIFNTFKFMCIYIFNKSLDFEESLVSHLMFGFTYKWLEPMYF